jgi:hypothetical protein
MAMASAQWVAPGDTMEKLSKKQTEEIRNLSQMKENEIDLSDLREVTDWSKAVVGKFYRQAKPERATAPKPRKPNK